MTYLFFCKGVTSYRTKILYVPQRPSLLSGSPQDFLTAITSLSVHDSKPRRQSDPVLTSDSIQQPTADIFERAHQLGEAWEIDRELWTRTWGNLSGGEAQRILLATAVALGTAEVLLLDGECNTNLTQKKSFLIDPFKQNPRPLLTRKLLT